MTHCLSLACRILGREVSVGAVSAVYIDPPIGRPTLGGNTTVRGFRFEAAAEVINLERNVLITGDHADFAETNKGLHVIGTYGGTMRVSHTRVEWCGQSAAEPPLGTGVKGRYCLHMHHMSHCPECVVEGNAIEHGIEKGVTVHDTHDMLVHRNVVWDLRGASIYVEDGNEINNTVSENVALCGDMPRDECKLPGTGINGVGFYIIGMNNHYLGNPPNRTATRGLGMFLRSPAPIRIFAGNRAAGFETGIYTNGGSHGQGPASGLSCPIFTRFARFEWNTMHDCRRWGLYLGNQMARNVVQDEDGFVRDRTTCDEFDANGKDNGATPVSIVADHFDWHVVTQRDSNSQSPDTSRP